MPRTASIRPSSARPSPASGPRPSVRSAKPKAPSAAQTEDHEREAHRVGQANQRAQDDGGAGQLLDREGGIGAAPAPDEDGEQHRYRPEEQPQAGNQAVGT